MSLLVIVLVLALIGVIVWLVTTYVPMGEPFRRVIIAVVIIGIILWLLDAFGLVRTGVRLY